MDETTRKEIALYLENAKRSLSVAQLNFENDFYAAAINRAYYAFFFSECLVGNQEIIKE